MAQRTLVPEPTGDLKKDYENLLDAFMALSKKVAYQFDHIEDSNTSVIGNISVNSEFLFVHLNGGVFIG